MAGGIAPRSRLSWLAILSRLCAAVLVAVALLAEAQSPRWILLASAGGFAILPLAWRRKAAAVPGAIFAASADYLPGGPGRGQFPGELSATRSRLAWTPSRHSSSQGLLPLTLAMRNCTAISMQGGPALLDVIVTVEGRNGGEWRFLTHRSPSLRRTIARLSDLISSEGVSA